MHTQANLQRTVKAARVRLRWDERGAATVELVIAMPLILLLLLSIAQFTIYLHATHIAQAAAAQGLSAARVLDGTSTAGDTEASRVLDQLHGPLQVPSIATHRGIDQVTVTVSGNVLRVVPFLTLNVHARSVGPVEKWVEAEP